MGLELAARIGVELDRRRLADPHAAKLGFLEVGIDPGITRLDQREKGGARRDILAHAEGRRLRDDAVRRRGDGGAVEVVGSLVARGERREHRGVLVDVEIGLAAKRGERALHGLVGGGLAFAGLQEIPFGGVETRGGDDALVRKRLLAVVVGPVVVEIAFRRIRLRDGLRIGRLHLPDVQARGRERGIGLFERDPVRLRIDLEERIARLYDAVVMHHDPGHAARHRGADRHPRLLEVGVVGRLVAPAGQPDIAAAKRQHDRQRQHQREASAALRLRGRRARRHLCGRSGALRHRALPRHRVHSAAPSCAASPAASSRSIRPRLATMVVRLRISISRSSALRPSSARS